MATYGELLDRVQKKDLMDGPPLAPDDNEFVLLVRLNQLRRQFAHFSPQGWSIEIKLLLNIMPAALKAIEHLLTTQPRVVAQLEDEQKEKIQSLLATARAALHRYENPGA